MAERTVSLINAIVWNPGLVVLLIGAGLYFTVRTRCVQIRRLPLMVGFVFSRDKGNHGSLSSFQAFCVALSGRVGTGNIVGVATAIALGGPGAVFWMWIIAFLGASTAFAESTLANKYQIRSEHGWRGGPSFYIRDGLGLKWLGAAFAILTILGYGILLVQVQSNGVSSAFANSFNINPLYTGIGTAAILGTVIVGGMKRIARIASMVIPFMALVYLAMAAIIILANIESVPAVFRSIFAGAFGMDQVLSGIVGSTIAMGVKRGLFSNEAGEGGGAIVSGSADVTMPAKQGLAQAFSVYIDTLLVCTATALMILCTGKYNVFDGNGKMLVCNVPELGSNYVGFTQSAIDTVFHGIGGGFVAIALAFFAFTTIMAYYMYTESSILYLIPEKRNASRAIKTYRLLIISLVIIGAVNASDVVWTLADIGVGLTTWVNVIVLLILFPQALLELKKVEESYPERRRRRK